MKRFIAGAAAALLFASGLCIPVSAERWMLTPEQIEAAKDDKLIIARMNEHWTLLPDTEYYPLTQHGSSYDAVFTLEGESYQKDPEYICLDGSIFGDVSGEQIDAFLQTAMTAVSDTDVGLVRYSEGSYALAYYDGGDYCNVAGQALGKNPDFYFSVTLSSGGLPVEYFERIKERPDTSEVCRIYGGTMLGFVTKEELNAGKSLVVSRNERPGTRQTFYIDHENRWLEAWSLTGVVHDIPPGLACEVRLNGNSLSAAAVEGDAEEIIESAIQAGAEFETQPPGSTVQTEETHPEKKKTEHPVLFSLTTLFTVLSVGVLILIVFTWVRFS